MTMTDKPSHFEQYYTVFHEHSTLCKKKDDPSSITGIAYRAQGCLEIRNL